MDEHGTEQLAEGIQLAADAIIGATCEGVITSWNNAAIELLGYTPEEAVGSDLGSLWPSEDGGDGLGARVVAGEALNQAPTTIVHKDGSKVDACVTVSRVGSPDEVIGLSILLRDPSKGRAPDEKFRALLESAPDAMVIAGTDGRIILVNRQTEVIFGYSRDELLGQPVEILVPEEDRRRHAAHRSGFFIRPNTRPMGAGLDLYGLRKDGTRFPVEISLSPIATEDGLVVCAAIRDGSERKKAEEQTRHIEHMETRRRQALELNDEIVQGLTVAKMAYDLGRGPETVEAITKTLKAAQSIISEMLVEETEGRSLAEGDLVRERPAHWQEKSGSS